jgi:hypothetical protein
LEGLGKTGWNKTEWYASAFVLYWAEKYILLRKTQNL